MEFVHTELIPLRKLVDGGLERRHFLKEARLVQAPLPVLRLLVAEAVALAEPPCRAGAGERGCCFLRTKPPVEDEEQLLDILQGSRETGLLSCEHS